MTQEEYAKLPPEAQATIRAGVLMQQLLSDPDAAKQLMPLVDKAAKRANPAHVTVEEQAAPIVERVLKQVDEKLAARTKDELDNAAKTKLEAQIAAAKADRGFTDEGIKNILTMMQQQNIGDFDAAVKAYLFDHPPTPAAPPGNGDRMDWGFYHQIQKGDAKPFFFPDGEASITENPEAWERETALKYLKREIDLPTS